jgi:hypothetical protein
MLDSAAAGAEAPCSRLELSERSKRCATQNHDPFKSMPARATATAKSSGQFRVGGLRRQTELPGRTAQRAHGLFDVVVLK